MAAWSRSSAPPQSNTALPSCTSEILSIKIEEADTAQPTDNDPWVIPNDGHMHAPALLHAALSTAGPRWRQPETPCRWINCLSLHWMKIRSQTWRRQRSNNPIWPPLPPMEVKGLPFHQHTLPQSLPLWSDRMALSLVVPWLMLLLLSTGWYAERIYSLH